MKIIYIANIRIPTEKAHGVQIMEMCSAFSNAGNDVTLVVPKRLNNTNETPFDFYGIKENFKIVKLPVLDLVRFGKIGFWIQSTNFAKFATIYSLFKKSDLIYSRDELPLWFLSFFKNNLVLEIHIAKNNFISKRVFKKVKNIIAITQKLKDFYVKEYGVDEKKIFWSPDAVDLKNFLNLPDKNILRKEFDIPSDKKVVTYIGKLKTMGKSKGVEDIIEVFPRILEKNKQAFFLLVGINKSEIEDIVKIFEKFNINQESYKLVTHIPKKKIPEYLKISNVLIMSYPNIEHYALYMSPMKLFEYMASGNPIVASGLPSIREILNEENSVLVEPDDLDSLAHGINIVLSDDLFAKKIGNQAFSDVQNYTWDKRVAGILNFLCV
ncbi:hypothetical protein A2996_02175 [Candidatus Campbellbacteria bacterium RIFCSPLOWO2_01_FULL_34_15]|uniref:Glycosyl transferase family 1 domain-containing protein n=2 Tax=Candidatus Campbelliibacteriota TaxID=1752727 RepID=A0A1F5ELY1_9BACT|nr:MAG: hypothetical protein A2996_02175 [Candidatus Campbellbacteria bacterium RIFCSPLOWO2_01_FULL_34_15]OGD69577.1 MAG: hypothetical protein A2811_01615 [Candidatus Campbellbacteria bacterium RIFCSPHIGHO2_01_FULL_34_10]